MNDRDQKVINKAIKILDSKLRDVEIALDSPDAVETYLRLRLQLAERETFSIMFLDAQHRLIKYTELFYGTIDQSAVYPREVVKEVLANNAAVVIFSHNHPSGIPEPSTADRQITAILQKALKLIDVDVLDHIVIGGGECVSFAQRGYLY